MGLLEYRRWNENRVDVDHAKSIIPCNDRKGCNGARSEFRAVQNEFVFSGLVGMYLEE